MRQRLAMSTIRLARRAFFGSPVERLPIVGRLRSIVFRYGFGSQELAATIRGLNFALPKGDVSLGPALVGKYYEELELEVYEQLARGSSVIADVGGNIGLYSCIGAAAMPDGRVVAFEPAPGNLEFLRRNVDANGVGDRVEIVGAAVSDKSGEARLYLSDSMGNHSLAAENAASARHVDVPVTTIDEHFGGARVDILKIDVEGFDVHVLRGARETLAKHRPTLFVELLSVRLEQSGVAPSDLIGEITDASEQIFVVDEIRNSVRRISRDELLALAERHTHTNLVAVSRPEHLLVLERFVRRRGRDARITMPG